MISKKVMSQCLTVDYCKGWNDAVDEIKQDLAASHGVGTCKYCANKKRAIVNKKGFLICPASGMEITDTDFCSYFDPEEEEMTDAEMAKESGYLCPICKHHKLCMAPGTRPLCMETYDYFERDDSVK